MQPIMQHTRQHPGQVTCSRGRRVQGKAAQSSANKPTATGPDTRQVRACCNEQALLPRHARYQGLAALGVHAALDAHSGAMPAMQPSRTVGGEAFPHKVALLRGLCLQGRAQEGQAAAYNKAATPASEKKPCLVKASVGGPSRCPDDTHRHPQQRGHDSGTGSSSHDYPTTPCDPGWCPSGQCGADYPAAAGRKLQRRCQEPDQTRRTGLSPYRPIFFASFFL